VSRRLGWSYIYQTERSMTDLLYINAAIDVLLFIPLDRQKNRHCITSQHCDVDLRMFYLD